MSWLEVRVAELEAENRALKGDTREPSPSLTSISCNTVNLATVAPPPADLDVKPVIEKEEPTLASEPSLTSIQAENAALKERIVLLEDLVKQVVAVSNLAGIDKPTDTLAVPSGITQTLSPSFAPVTEIIDTDPFTLVPDQTSNLTCHPAAMATRQLALQRVRTRSTSFPVTTARLDMVARLIVALARTSPWDKCSLGTRGRNRRSRQKWRIGTRR